MMSRQVAEEYARGMMDEGKSAAEANVEIVRMIGVEIVHSRMPREVRSALNAAVKRGYIGHLPKEGLRPENWTQNTFAKDADGNFTDPRSANACRWCALGALQNINNTFNIDGRYYLSICVPAPYSPVWLYNDKHTHAEVLALFDKAIAAAEKDGY